MKSVFNFFMNLLILIIFIIEVLSADFTYPSALSLLNGNIFVVEQNGIFVYDEQLKIIIHNYTFEEEDKITNLNSLSNVIVKYKRNYILCLINSKIYFFDNNGENILITNKIITDENVSHLTLTLIGIAGGYYYYYYSIGYFLYDYGIYYLKIIAYRIHLIEKTNNYIGRVLLEEFTSSFWGNHHYFANAGLGCEYMESEDNDEEICLVCFFLIKNGYSLSLTHNFFNIYSDSIEINNNYYYKYIEDLYNVKQIQVVTTIARKNSLVCVLFTDENLECYKFKFSTGLFGGGKFFSNIKTNFNCRNVLYGMKLNYLADVNNIALSCINSNAIVQAIFFNEDLELINSFQQFTECESIYGHSVLNSKNNSAFYVISDAICNNIKRCFEPLEGTLSSIEEIDIVSPSQIISDVSEKGEEENEEEKEIEVEKIIEEEVTQIIIEETTQIIEVEKTQLIKEEEITHLDEQKFDCSILEKCGECDQESYSKNLCINCNKEKNYYYLNYFPSKQRNKYINCVNEKTKPQKFYFNKINLDYESCYATCSSCEYGGNAEENNCTSCDGINYIKNPQEENSLNCVTKCKYFYYIEHDIYSYTEIPFCPEEYNYLIKDKSKCTNNCKEDNEYKYKYNSECFKECPNNTKDDNDFICKDTEINKCTLTENKIKFIEDNNTFNELEKLVNKYIEEFNYTDNHVSVYKNDELTITIYIKNKCILELDLEIPEIDFGSCYDNVIKNNKDNISELIIAVIDKKSNSKNDRKILQFGMFSPINGKYQNSEEICAEDKIIFIESIENKILQSGIDINLIREFVNEGIDMFNLTSKFYTDICFQYNSKKDVPLKDRVLEYFPNISLCEEGCEFLGINMTTITSICECFYSETKREENLKDKVLEETQISFIEDIITSSNIYVLKCIYQLFKGKNIKKCYGGFIVLSLFIIEIICAIFYCHRNIYSINKYIFGITNKYINFLSQQKPDIIIKKSIKKKTKKLSLNNNNNKNSAPPKQNIKNSKDNINPNIQKIIRKTKNPRKTEFNGEYNLVINNNKDMKIKNNYNINKIYDVNANNDKYFKEKARNSNREFSHFSDKALLSRQKYEASNEYNSLFNNIKDDLDINIEEYLETQFDDMDYDEAIRKDKRRFAESFMDKLRDNQIIINTFCSDEPIRPGAIKIIFLILQFDLYFFINGLFYDEEYISKIYHLEKDTFLTMAERFFDNLIYAALAGIIINYIIEFFFIEEQKIKKILKMEKDNIFVLKYEMIKILKSIKTRYKLFIIISFIISFIAIIHIFCFNIVYYHTMIEWIIFSLIIILSIQIGSFMVCLLQTALRFISFKFKSEKLFKLSL